MAKFLPKRNELPPKKPITMASSVVDLASPSWDIYKLRNEEWQQETWRFYDLIGELRYAANWIGSACSRVRIYVADVDPYGRIGEEVEDPEIQAISDNLFGGPASKSEMLRSMGINLTIAGECYIIGKSVTSGKDEWYIVSPEELKKAGGTLSYKYGGKKIELVKNKDIAIRVWTPHPRNCYLSDSPAKSALLILREIEQLTKYVFSQIDSRLSGAGLLVIPNGMDFPQSDEDIGAVETFIELLGEAMSASMTQDGTAKSVVPVVVERPRGAGEDNKFELIKFDSELTNKTKELRDEAIRRLALSLDMPPEILLGTGDTNHWSAWHIEESTVKIHIEPMMTRICDALTQAYLVPILKLTEQPQDAYTFWFDTSPLTVRPNRLQDTLNLYERGIVSAQTVLEAGAYNPGLNAPDEDEDNRRYMRELVLRDPTLFAVPAVRELIGIDVEIATPEVEAPPAVGESAGPPPPPAPERATPSSKPELPQQPSATKPANKSSVLASGEPELVPGPSTFLVAADLLVHRALELAGKRLHKSRDRDRWIHVPPHELHTYLKVRDHEHAERLLMGAWEHLDAITEDLGVHSDDLRLLLHNYSKELLVRSMPHSRSLLTLALQRSGLMHG